MFVVLLCSSLLTAATAQAQPAPFNEAGVTMGHWHIASKDVEADKKLFRGVRWQAVHARRKPAVHVPRLYINLVLGTEKGDGGTEGSVINHVGFIVNNVQERVAQWKAAGVAVLPGLNNRSDQAFVVTPDGVRIEILEDKTQPVAIRNEHVHLSLPDTEIPKAQAWYAKTFGGKTGARNGAPGRGPARSTDRFARADAKQAGTRGRALDHIGFDVKDHAAVVKRIVAQGITLDEPVRKSAAGNTITYITDPWGTRIENRRAGTLGPAGAVNESASSDRAAVGPLPAAVRLSWCRRDHHRHRHSYARARVGAAGAADSRGQRTRGESLLREVLRRARLLPARRPMGRQRRTGRCLREHDRLARTACVGGERRDSSSCI
jgi:catechol 2,3-dioxygenase-like lactoylglutathione lyase family enzyme